MDVLSALPFSSQIMIHPDGAIRDANLRRAHVYPKYRDLFLDRLEQDPPQCIVLYRREGKAELSSQADTAIKALVRDKYRREYHIRNADFTGKWSDYEIYLRTR